MIKDAILEDMKASMRSQDKVRLVTIRLILSALKQREVDERITLTDVDVLQILNKMLKQRRDSITQFQNGGRPDLVEKELAEIKVIQCYLPEQLSHDELIHVIDSAIVEAAAASARDIGKVMALVKPKVQDRADMAEVSQLVKDKLTALAG